MKVMDTYVEPIFMHNSEVWTTNKSHKMSFDAFQRKLIRKYVFDNKWQNKMSNEQLYEKTDVESWRKKITLRRLKLFRKLASQPENIPTKKALRYGQAKYRRPQGKPKTTWISKVNEDLKKMNISWSNAEHLARENLSE